MHGALNTAMSMEVNLGSVSGGADVSYFLPIWAQEKVCVWMTLVTHSEYGLTGQLQLAFAKQHAMIPLQNLPSFYQTQPGGNVPVCYAAGN